MATTNDRRARYKALTDTIPGPRAAAYRAAAEVAQQIDPLENGAAWNAASDEAQHLWMALTEAERTAFNEARYEAGYTRRAE